MEAKNEHISLCKKWGFCQVSFYRETFSWDLGRVFFKGEDLGPLGWGMCSNSKILSVISQVFKQPVSTIKKNHTVISGFVFY